MSARNIARTLSVALALVSALSALVGTRHAYAGPCADVEVVFARGTNEPPGVGPTGQAFVDSLTSEVPGRSVGVYAVNFPANHDLSNSASVGANDASAHVQHIAATCPNTRMVLGGYSIGAVVIDLITAAGVPPRGFIPAPMPAKVADHVAAVAVLGNPWAKSLGAPLTALSPLYGAKAIDLCNPGDPVCSDGENSSAHLQYVQSALPGQAATFAASRL